MLFSSTLAAAIVLATGANAAVLTRNKNVAQFRIYGETGCHEKNLGVWTVIDDDIKNNPCKTFRDDVKSVTVEQINVGCKLHVFTDKECKNGGHTVKQSECHNEAGGLKAWSMQCA
ncbi:Uncharacterized protein TPAR_02791 [Tolypocladium paradoxum]|uniref:Uncharacterized protein n=1 Tax=Tolypocladium paradoxum TaxID=94208 RepID=A0A2S4L3J3_9HYPO|nr:Uncharacterized protein TPAR_02791 [Tolypocladium paradoxum]